MPIDHNEAMQLGELRVEQMFVGRELERTHAFGHVDDLLHFVLRERSVALRLASRSPASVDIREEERIARRFTPFRTASVSMS